jgi:hypothetical protein
MTLQHSLAGAVAFAALISVAQAADLRPVLKAPAAEPQQATGYVEIYGGWASTRATETFCDPVCDSGSTRFNGWALGGAGRGNYWINRDVSVQLDAQAEGTSYDFPDNFGPFSGGHFSTHSYLVGGHFSWRSPQQHLFGLFAAVGDAGGGLFTPSERHGVFGAEAQWYWNQFTLYLQGGYDTTLGNVGFGVDDMNAWFIRTTGRYFVTSNFLIEATGMYANGDINFSPFVLDPGDSSSMGFETWLWQVKAEYRLPTAPFSIFAKYQGSETRYDSTILSGDIESAKVTDHRVLFGVKLHMGDKSLQGTDRGGATLDIIDPLSNPTGPLMFGPLGGLSVL